MNATRMKIDNPCRDCNVEDICKYKISCSGIIKNITDGLNNNRQPIEITQRDPFTVTTIIECDRKRDRSPSRDMCSLDETKFPTQKAISPIPMGKGEIEYA